MPEVIASVEQQLKQESLSLVEHAKKLKVTDQATYSEACNYLQKTIIPFRQKWSEFWNPLRSAAWESYKGIQQKFREGDEPLEQAERLVKNAIRIFDDTQAKIEAERQRQAQMEAERTEREERLRAAIMAEESGASEAEVQAIVDASTAVVAAPVSPVYARASGISKRENWKAQITNLHDLVKAAAKDKALMPYLEANMTALNARARADKSTLRIPGVVAWNDAVVSARGR